MENNLIRNSNKNIECLEINIPSKGQDLNEEKLLNYIKEYFEKI